MQVLMIYELGYPAPTSHVLSSSVITTQQINNFIELTHCLTPGLSPGLGVYGAADTRDLIFSSVGAKYLYADAQNTNHSPVGATQNIDLDRRLEVEGIRPTTGKILHISF